NQRQWYGGLPSRPRERTPLSSSQNRRSLWCSDATEPRLGAWAPRWSCFWQPHARLPAWGAMSQAEPGVQRAPQGVVRRAVAVPLPAAEARRAAVFPARGALPVALALPAAGRVRRRKLFRRRFGA